MPGAELSFNHAVEDESNGGVEVKGVRVRGDVDPSDAFGSGDHCRVDDQTSADTSPHPRRIDEQIVELGERSGQTHRCESDDSFAIDRHTGTPLEDGQISEVQCVRMSEKARTITVVGQRRPPVQIPHSNDVVRRGRTDGKTLHARSLHHPACCATYCPTTSRSNPVSTTPAAAMRRSA